MTTDEQLPMVAIPSMNDTHLEEMLIINRLDTAIANSDVAGISKLLDELLEHTTVHFTNENNLMEKGAYPDYAQHKSEHDRHIQELTSLVSYFERTQEPKAIYAYSKGNLTPWRIHHIQTMDTAMALYLTQV
ncbi:MAG: hemerythrin family protein [Sulfuricurvum sp.]|nr:hemerythrin family protein [Sulfuricurvum sp.]